MAGLRGYLAAAFSARPLGMPVPPNWLGLAGFGLLGLVNPGFWLIGLGVEAAYLLWLSHSPRFRAVVDGRELGRRSRDEQSRWEAARGQLMAQLDRDDRERYEALAERCGEVLDRQGAIDPAGLEVQRGGLGRLLWVYLRLLAGRASIARLVSEACDGEADRLQDKAKGLLKRLEGGDLSAELKRSIQGQLEIVQNRLARQHEAREKLTVIEAELGRIDEQVGLLRDQALLAADPKAVSARIDEISANLGETGEWISSQRTLLGQLDEPAGSPPLAARATAGTREGA